MADRRTQPYRRGARNAGPALDAMLKGRDAMGGNPADLTRNVQRLIRAGRQQRPERPARPPRPERPAR